MVKAIDFVVRDSAGAVVRGSVAGGGSNFVQLGTGEEISLNLARQSVTAFQQRGSDLVITLVDGREIVLSGYFNQTGEPNQLYLSQNGEVIPVEFSDAGNGHLMASYGSADGWDKFSTLDDLRFGNGDDLALAQGAVSDDPAGMAAFVPGLLGLGGGAAAVAGLGVAAAVVGGGGGGGDGSSGNGGTPGRAQPTVDEPESRHVVTTNTDDKTLEVSGTGEPGDTVTVTIGGKEQETVIDGNGKWQVEFDETELPADGSHETEVVVKQPGGTETTLDGPTFVLDLTPPDVAVTQGARSNNHVENLAAYADGVTIGGTGEIGAKIEVKVGSVTRTTTVDQNGNWSVNYSQSQVAGGERSERISVTATDALGNRTVIGDWLDLDTIPNPIGFNKVTADNTVNHAESAAGFQISGTSVAGAVLTVTIPNGAQAVTQTVTADQNGNWAFNFAAGALVGGERTATITATSTDAAGNVTNTAYSFKVDTLVSNFTLTNKIGGDGMLNATERADGETLTGTCEPGSTVVVRLSNGSQVTTTSDASGNWSAYFTSAQLPAGTSGSATATITATDHVGNTAAPIVHTFTYDTAAPSSPELTDILRNAGAVSGVMVEVEQGSVTTFHQVAANGAATDLHVTNTTPMGGSELFLFGNGGVSDGSYLVIGGTDAAQNPSSTLAVVNHTTAVNVDLSRAGLDGFDFASIDLTFAPDAKLTLTASDLQRLTGPDHELLIKGDSDDAVKLGGAQDTHQVRHIDGQDYAVYALGDGLVLVDDDITTTII